MNTVSGNPDFLYRRYMNTVSGARSYGKGISAQADLTGEGAVTDKASGAPETDSSGHVGASTLSDKLNDLVSNGTITEGEKKELISGLEEVRKKAPSPLPLSPEMADRLDSLVGAGTISEDQADAVVSALESFAGSPNPLQDLVDEGTLTQDQMGAITSSFQSAMRMKHAQKAYGAVMPSPLKRW